MRTLLYYIFDSLDESDLFRYRKAVFPKEYIGGYSPKRINFERFFNIVGFPLLISIPFIFIMGVLILIVENANFVAAYNFLMWIWNAYFATIAVYYASFATLFMIVPLIVLLLSILSGTLKYLKQWNTIRKVNKIFFSDKNTIVPTAIFGVFNEQAWPLLKNMHESNPFILNDDLSRAFEYYVEVVDMEKNFVKIKPLDEFSRKKLHECHKNKSINMYRHDNGEYSLKKKDFLSNYNSTGSFTSNFELSEAS